MTRNRYRGLRANPHTLGVTPLTAGEVSRPVRIRAAAEVHTWLSTLSAAQVGDLLADAYRANVEAQMHYAGPVDALKERGSMVQFRLGPAASTAKMPHHLGLLADLAAGATLTAINGVHTLTRPDGNRRTVHPKTAAHMLKTGMLAAEVLPPVYDQDAKITPDTL